MQAVATRRLVFMEEVSEVHRGAIVKDPFVLLRSSQHESHWVTLGHTFGWNWMNDMNPKFSLQHPETYLPEIQSQVSLDQKFFAQA